MDFNFKNVGTCDISNIKTKILNMNQEIWFENELRQKTFDAHKDTQTIDLMWDMNSLMNNTIGQIKNHFYNFGIDTFLNEVKPLYQNFYGQGDFIRVLITKLKKKSLIKPHADKGYSLSVCNRTHIPIITNDLVSFTVENEMLNMKEGEIWEINNQKIHSVSNNSEIDRIHLIVDYFVQTNYKENKRLL